MTDALQFVVYCNCAMQLSESSKHQAQKINTDCSPTAGSYESLYFLKLCINKLPLQNKCTNHTQESPANKSNFTFH
jgi:hypothetical protein